MTEIKLTAKQAETLKQLAAQEQELKNQCKQLEAIKAQLLVFALESAGLDTNQENISVQLEDSKLIVTYGEGGQIPNPALEIAK